MVDRLYHELNGHPGLTCWFGELLTEGYEGYQADHARPLSRAEFARAYAAATHILPNNTIVNLISKAKQPPYKEFLLEVFTTPEGVEFRYDDPCINFLYMHGVITPESVDGATYDAKFASPFVQKRLFHYFAGELFHDLGPLVEPFAPLEDIMTADVLRIAPLLARY